MFRLWCGNFSFLLYSKMKRKKKKILHQRRHISKSVWKIFVHAWPVLQYFWDSAVHGHWRIFLFMSGYDLSLSPALTRTFWYWTGPVLACQTIPLDGFYLWALDGIYLWALDGIYLWALEGIYLWALDGIYLWALYPDDLVVNFFFLSSTVQLQLWAIYWKS